MKLGIKKLHENEWQLHIESAFVRVDRYSLELLQIVLGDLLEMDLGHSTSVIAGHEKLASKLLDLDSTNLQLILRSIDNEDLLKMMVAVNNTKLTEQILENVGGIMSQQLESDARSISIPSDEEAIKSIKKIVEKMYELEASGKIEFKSYESRFI